MLRRHLWECLGGLALVLGIFCGLPAWAGPVLLAPGIAIPQAATPILSLDEIRVGMKGYGLSVFHGDKIEPFTVQVVSVMRNFSPQRSVIWIRCPDENMQKLGPVQGMSGSPIYLWAQDEEPIPGKGGRLIGAFAYGFMLTKDCYAGVQPIQQMRQVVEVEVAQAATARREPSAGGDWRQVHQELSAISRSLGRSPGTHWREKVLLEAMEKSLPASGEASRATSQAPSVNGTALVPDGQATAPQQARPMLLPIAVRTPAVAQMLAPMFAQRGLALISGGAGTAIGHPPEEIDLRQLRIEPGSTLAIPLAFGDLDLSAAGTVTEILPDGRVLGFGHPFLGQGAIALPMASGFVHYVVPSFLSSFKLAGSGNIVGSIVRDETSAVLGIPEIRFTTAPAKIRVKHIDRPAREYRYELVHHRQISPMIAAIVAVESLMAETGLPPENTLSTRGELRFSGNRRLNLQSRTPGGSPMSLVFELLMPLMMLSENPFESLRLESMDFSVEVQPGISALSLVEARVEQTQLQPGSRVRVHATLQPYGRPAFTRTLEFLLPANLPDGQYTMTLSGARGYQAQMMQMRPHLMRINNIEDLLNLMQQLGQVRDDALYLTMPTPGEGLAVGRSELPLLPSSRRAMLATPWGTATSPMGSWLEQVVPMDEVPQGSLSFVIEVRKDGPAR